LLVLAFETVWWHACVHGNAAHDGSTKDGAMSTPSARHVLSHSRSGIRSRVRLRAANTRIESNEMDAASDLQESSE
jgi:hypothetical protein